jgi:hypothetical protein
MEMHPAPGLCPRQMSGHLLPWQPHAALKPAPAPEQKDKLWPAAKPHMTQATASPV